MNWDALGSIAELLAALTVIGSVVYLAKQIRQNTLAVKTQVMNAWLSDLNEAFLVLREPDFATIVRKGTTDFPNLTLDEKFQFGNAYVIPICLISQNFFFNSKEGHVQEEVLHRNLEFAAHVVATPGGREVWRFSKPFFAAEFATEIERRLPDVSGILSMPWFSNNDA